MVGKCIWRIVVFTACVCVGVACSFCLALALAFGFWGQFSSVSSHHFVWIVFTVAVEFRGMQIDFGDAGQLFKPASKLRALKSCTHTHTRTHTWRERDRDRYLVGMRVFQFSRTFHCSSLKISQNFARLVGQWAWQSVGQLYCVWNCVDYDQSSAQVSGQPPRAGRWKRANINHGMPAALFELQLEFGLALALALARSLVLALAFGLRLRLRR